MLKSTPPVRNEEQEKIRIVLDTNVLVSAFLSPLGTPGQVVSMTLQGHLQFCYSLQIMNEYDDVLSRSGFKFKALAEERRSVLESLREDGLSFNIVASSIFPMQDESDRVFYDAAKTAGAFLVTGNKKHYPDEPFIVTPRYFIDSVINAHM